MTQLVHYRLFLDSVSLIWVGSLIGDMLRPLGHPHSSNQTVYSMGKSSWYVYFHRKNSCSSKKTLCMQHYLLTSPWHTITSSQNVIRLCKSGITVRPHMPRRRVIVGFSLRSRTHLNLQSTLLDVFARIYQCVLLNYEL